jgi:Flp pilus assembly protein TadB
MHCYITGILAIGLMAAALSAMTVSQEQHDRLREVLSDELDQIHERIVVERRNQYIMGLVLGAVLAFLLLRVYPASGRYHRMTMFILVMLSTAVLFYLLAPKSDYMLHHLKTPEENRAWLEVYKTMKQRYVVGLILGGLAAVPLSYSFCS